MRCPHWFAASMMLPRGSVPSEAAAGPAKLPLTRLLRRWGLRRLQRRSDRACPAIVRRNHWFSRPGLPLVPWSGSLAARRSGAEPRHSSRPVPEGRRPAEASILLGRLSSQPQLNPQMAGMAIPGHEPTSGGCSAVHMCPVMPDHEPRRLRGRLQAGALCGDAVSDGPAWRSGPTLTHLPRVSIERFGFVGLMLSLQSMWEQTTNRWIPRVRSGNNTKPVRPCSRTCTY